MKFLAEAESTIKSTSNRSTRSVKQLLIDYLIDKTVDRHKLAAHLAYIRWEDVNGEITSKDVMATKEWRAMVKTMKDGIDTAVANGSNGFNNSKYGDDYELVRSGNDLTVIKR